MPYSDMVPVQKIHGEQNGEIGFTDLVMENKKRKVKTHGQHSLKATSNQQNLMSLFIVQKNTDAIIFQESLLQLP